MPNPSNDDQEPTVAEKLLTCCIASAIGAFALSFGDLFVNGQSATVSFVAGAARASSGRSRMV